MNGHRQEKILISSPTTKIEQNRKELESAYKLKKHWRTTSAGLTALGGLLAFFCLMCVVLAPHLINRIITNGFWNTSFGNPRSQLYSELIFWEMLDEDYGHVGSYAIGLIVGLTVFYFVSQLFETLGFPIFREGSRQVFKPQSKNEP